MFPAPSYGVCIALSVLVAACSGAGTGDGSAHSGESAAGTRSSGSAGALGAAGASAAAAGGGRSGASGMRPDTGGQAGAGGAATGGKLASGSGAEPSAGMGGVGPAAAGGGGTTAVAGTGSAAGSGADNDRCDVAVLDASSPPQVLELSGDLGTHDPSAIVQGDVFYLHQTGPRLPGKTSRDLMKWNSAPAALGDRNPAWVAQQVPDATDLWAPDLSFFGGQYHLYYAASSFGTNSSCIGHATRKSMAEGAFADQGQVVCSNHGSKDDWNAIDPNAIADVDGKFYLFFGSFWDGIKVIELKEDGSRANDALHAVASRGGGAIEAPYVVRRCGYYYLFVSFDRCCQGAMSTYNIRVGRSDKVLGPYLDKSGKAMMDGGGSELVMGGTSFKGPGHNAVLFHGKKAYNIYHAYRADNGNSVLRVSELVWDADGWPVSAGP